MAVEQLRMMQRRGEHQGGPLQHVLLCAIMQGLDVNCNIYGN
jgi:hypothetical protein